VVGSTVAMESLGASPRTFDWPSGRRPQRGLTTIGDTERDGNCASSVAVFPKPRSSGATDARAVRLTEKEVARLALQLRETQCIRAQKAGETAALAIGGNDEHLGEVPSQSPLAASHSLASATSS
jgi:hypothetical protein